MTSPRPRRSRASKISNPDVAASWEDELLKGDTATTTTTGRPAPTRAVQTTQALQAFTTGQGALALLPLATGMNPRVTRAIEVFTIGQLALKSAKQVHEFVKSRRAEEDVEPGNWLVKIQNSDALFEIGLELISQQAKSNQRVLLAEATVDVDYDPFTDERKANYGVKTVPETFEDRNIVLEGHHIVTKVTRESQEEREKKAAAMYDSVWNFQPELHFYAFSDEAQQAVIRALETESKKRNGTKVDRKPLLRTYGKGGYWQARRDVPIRHVDSVVVSHDQVNVLVEDIKQFLDREEEYARRGVPWHRGYLLYGPPGTGKTSAVKAVSGAVGLDLWYASLREASGDSSLESIVSEVGSRSLLLLEDIDSFKAARERNTDTEDREKTVSTSGLLNVLDGVTTPHGLITIMTTNHRDFLDPALLRPGRIDRQLEFGLPDDDTVRRHFEFFYQQAPSRPLVAGGRSSAEVSEILLTHLFDPASAEQVLAADGAGLDGDHAPAHALAAGSR